MSIVIELWGGIETLYVLATVHLLFSFDSVRMQSGSNFHQFRA